MTTTTRLLFGATLTALEVTLMVACSKTPEAMAPAAAPITMGTQVDDAVITSGVKSALLGDEAIKSFDLQVETRKGTVQLSGFVDSQAQIDMASKLAGAAEGASSVKNELMVKQ